MTTRTLLTTAAGLLVGLQAGLYFAFSCGVMPALARLDDRTFVETMTRINVVIVNPLFLLTFFGAPVAAILVALLGGAERRPLLIAAAVLAVLTFLITVAANVPLNDALAAHGTGADALARARSAFESAWVRWNVLRTLTATAALGLLMASARTGAA